MAAVPAPRSFTLPVPDGLLVIDKPEGPTSHDVVARARRALGVRQLGHAGTLDPMATGVLALLVGRATRLAQFLSSSDKAYDAVVRLGIATDTWDRTGTIVRQSEERVDGISREAVAGTLAALVGEQDQVPPPFSAKKIEGVRAYRLARQGRPTPVRPARVTLHTARLVSFEAPLVRLEVHCSAGFYVRALAHELGGRLGCGACLDALRRTAAGGQTLREALTLATLEENAEAAAARMVPLERALPHLPSLVLTEPGMRRVLHGNDVGPGDVAGRLDPASARVRGAVEPLESAPPGAVQLLDPAGRLIAIARPASAPGVLHPAVVLK